MEGQYADVKAPVLGPAAAQVVKVMGRYRYHLTMRARDSARFRSLVSGVLREFMLDSRNRGVTVSQTAIRICNRIPDFYFIDPGKERYP